MSDLLPPGPELDALIAEKVMALDHRHSYIDFEMDTFYAHCRTCGREQGDATKEEFMATKCPVPPPYSTSIADAWTVVEKLMVEGVIIQYLTGTWEVLRYNHDWEVIGEAPTAPLAICYAALRAVG